MCEVYKAQRQLRPIQLKISLVEIQDFTQVKNYKKFHSILSCSDTTEKSISYI